MVKSLCGVAIVKQAPVFRDPKNMYTFQYIWSVINCISINQWKTIFLQELDFEVTSSIYFVGGKYIWSFDTSTTVPSTIGVCKFSNQKNK